MTRKEPRFSATCDGFDASARDPIARRRPGSSVQAFSHLALIESAFELGAGVDEEGRGDLVDLRGAAVREVAMTRLGFG